MENNTFLVAYSLELATGVDANTWIECSNGNIEVLMEAMNDQPVAWAYYNYFVSLAVLNAVRKEQE